VNATELLDDLRSKGVSLETDGERLLVDAPAGVIADEIKTTLTELKPKLLKLLTWERRKLEEADRRGLIVRWSEHPTWIKLHDPTTGEWHEVRASECLPSIVTEADKHRKKRGEG
jgi:hypothetical protein